MKYLAMAFCLIFTSASNASLIGDQVFVDRRDESIVISTTDAVVSEGYELWGWQNIYWDFYDYGVKLISSGAIGYFPSSFNGFDFNGLDFGSEYETISDVNAYFISASDGSINPLSESRLTFSDHSFSLNLGGIGLASSPLYIDISTTNQAVPISVSEPSSVWLFLSAIVGIGWVARKKIVNT